jgi:hypothetical protein
MAGFDDKNLPLFESDFISEDEQHTVRSALKMCYMIGNNKSSNPDPKITNLVLLTMKYLNYEGLFTEKPRMDAVIKAWEDLKQDYIAEGVRIRLKEAVLLQLQRKRTERDEKEKEIASGYNFLSDIDVEIDEEEAPLTQRSPLVAKVLNYSTTFLKLAMGTL